MLEAASGNEMARLANQSGVRAVAVSADGRYVATGTGRAAQVFDVATAKEVSRITRRSDEGEVLAVAFSPDGRYVVIGGEDYTGTATPSGSARVFDAASGKEVSRMISDGSVRAVRFLEGGRYLMTASVTTADNSKSQAVVARHLLRPQDLIDDACARFTRNLTQDEWKQYVGAEVPYHRTCSSLP